MYVSGARVCLYVRANSQAVHTSRNNVSMEQWHHVVLTNTPTGHKLYIDGVSITALTDGTSGLGWTPEALTIGASTETISGDYIRRSDPCRGFISDFCFLNRGISGQEAVALS
ncbi:unnamed protein product, partial [Ectocarpus fasciculatus]